MTERYNEKRAGHTGHAKTLGEVAYEAMTDHESRQYARPFTSWDELPERDKARWQAIGEGVAEFVNPGRVKPASSLRDAQGQMRKAFGGN